MYSIRNTIRIPAVIACGLVLAIATQSCSPRATSVDKALLHLQPTQANGNTPTTPNPQPNNPVLIDGLVKLLKAKTGHGHFVEIPRSKKAEDLKLLRKFVKNAQLELTIKGTANLKPSEIDFDIGLDKPLVYLLESESLYSDDRPEGRDENEPCSPKLTELKANHWELSISDKKDCPDLDVRLRQMKKITIHFRPKFVDFPGAV